ncbi:protein Star-like [Cloeon dipterum]|uniref:protein Star-like n=1 Tax=Cloeon dipterum TaxID=197152 RepID=UPI00321FD84D
MSFFTYSTFEAIKLDELEGDNPEVVTHVKKYMIIPPPNAAVKYESNHSAGLQLQHIFQNKTGGYFVESGANDGLHSSKTVQLENALAWTGALIEPDPGNVLLARDKKRNASLIPTCLSTSTKPKLSAFKAGQGVVLDISDSDLIVHCMPLHSILLALDKPSIDFLSLSVGGAELDILKTVPFDKFDIKVIMVNFEKISGGVEALQGFLSSNNYVIFPTIPAEQEKGQWAEFHRIFVKKGSGFKEE